MAFVNGCRVSGHGPHRGMVASVDGFDWTPKALGSALRLWLRADLGITLNGAGVSGWADQSGNGNHATQSTASYQPTWQSHNTTLRQGAGIVFDGVADRLQIDLALGATTTIAAVCTIPTQAAYIWGGSQAGAGPCIISNFTAGKAAEWWNSSGADRFDLGEANNAALRTIEVYQTDGSNFSCFFDGALRHSGTPTAAMSGSSLTVLGAATRTIVGTAIADMTMREFIVLNTVPTLRDRLLLRRYLRQSARAIPTPPHYAGE